ncbi:hypothetical protein, conserved [Leishmania tarentolae]|uniref:Uncharacterized protein n=1 Tax=Leishmania tarentolae TaxID=5689 RepID=A0A640KFP1_LEITA|nr:hypothetical protein, conserved [Leishmania tarentolae]
MLKASFRGGDFVLQLWVTGRDPQHHVRLFVARVHLQPTLNARLLGMRVHDRANEAHRPRVVLEVAGDGRADNLLFGVLPRPHGALFDGLHRQRALNAGNRQTREEGVRAGHKKVPIRALACVAHDAAAGESACAAGGRCFVVCLCVCVCVCVYVYVVVEQRDGRE